LRAAALDIDMSYSKAWTIIKRAEKLLGFELLDSKIGGVAGGGAALTKNAQRLLTEFRQYEKELKEYLQKK
jgi:molybdate transport system regulatory protein